MTVDSPARRATDVPAALRPGARVRAVPPVFPVLRAAHPVARSRSAAPAVAGSAVRARLPVWRREPRGHLEAALEPRRVPAVGRADGPDLLVIAPADRGRPVAVAPAAAPAALTVEPERAARAAAATPPEVQAAADGRHHSFRPADVAVRRPAAEPRRDREAERPDGPDLSVVVPRDRARPVARASAALPVRPRRRRL